MVLGLCLAGLGCPDSEENTGGIDGDGPAECVPACSDGQDCVDGACAGVTPDPCLAAPCVNGGTCTAEGESFACACAPGFSGDICQTNIDDCADAPCENGGTCSDGIAAFTCFCAD